LTEIRVRRAKGTERKMSNMKLLEECKSRSKCEVKIDGKRIKSDGKKGGKKALKAQKVVERKMSICIY
jgi:hypothetical protein